MKCHYVHDDEAGKVLIPCCWSVVHSQNIKDCDCVKRVESFTKFENERFNQILNEQNLYIKELEAENAKLKEKK